MSLKRFISNSLRFKLAIGSVVLGMTLLGTQAVLQFQTLRDELSGRIESHQFSLVSELAQHLDEKIGERMSALHRTGDDFPRAFIGNPQAIERYFREQTALLSLLDDLYYFDAEGMLLVDWPVKPGRRGLDMSSRDYIQTVRDTLRPAISAPILGKATKQPIVVMAAPVLDERGKLAGIIGGVLNLYKPNLIGALPERKIGQGGYFYLVAPDRTVISHPDRSRIMQQITRPGDNLLLDRALAGFEGSGEGINSRGLQGLFTFKRLASTGWILASVVPSAEAFQPIAEARQRIVISTLLFMPLAALLFWLFARHLLRPLFHLETAMRDRAAAMRPGTPAEAVPETGSQEIQTVARAFNGFLAARNQAESALAASEGRMSLIVENISDGIWDWHIEANHLYINPALQAMLGHRPGSVNSTFADIEDFIHPEDAGEVKKAIRDCVEGDAWGYSREHRMLTVDGVQLWVVSSGRIVERDAEGKALRMLGTIINVSERREYLEQLARAKDSAEEMSRVKSQFIANMSHEIRTPMNGVIGMIELSMLSDLDEEPKEYLRLALNSANSLLRILNDILDISKVEAGKLEIERIPFDLPALLQEVMQLILPTANEKGLQGSLDLVPVPAEVLGDPLRLRQILLNLLGNAIKFTHRGEITLSLRLTASAGDELTATFAVKDTGIGIPLNKQEEVFKAFTQADASVTRRYGGTGLGLTISSQLVHLLGGRLMLESREGEGSEFSFSLPFQLAARRQAA